MARAKYRWHIGSEPPKIDPHSLAKHEVLSEYLKQYVRTLAKDVRRDHFRLTVVDGFAGGGIYRSLAGNGYSFGSPLRILEAIDEASQDEQRRRQKPIAFDVRYWFIEEHRGTFDHLKYALQHTGYAQKHRSAIELRNASFQHEVENVVSAICVRGNAPRAIFVLDQYGYTDAPMHALRYILQKIPRAEIILTFATDWLLDHVADEVAFDRILRKAGLALSASDLVEMKQANPKEWRSVLQHVLHDDIRKQSGAKYYTPFFIWSPNAHRTYWLIHLSNHFRARDVMMGLHWSISNHFAHYGKPGMNMLGFDPRRDDIRRRGESLFDTSAEAATKEALLEELPERFRRYPNGVAFGEFFADHTNESPATSRQMKEATLRLVKEGQLLLYSPDGVRRTPKSVISDDDRIVVPRSTFVELPYRE